jgi:hypothetical protein
MDKKKNVLWVIISSMFFLIGAITYWSNYNSKAKINEVKEQILQLVIKSSKRRFSTEEVEIRNVKFKKQGRLTNEDIDRIFDNFLSDWKKSDTTNEKLNGEIQLKVQGYYEALERQYSNYSLNELIAVLIISSIFILFLSLACLSNLLRDITGDSVPISIETKYRRNLTSGAPNTNVSPPFSLSRTQLAVWITIIGSVYTYAVFWDNKDMPGINSTALLLMGISGGTFAIGAILDTMEIDSKTPRHQELYVKSTFFKDILNDGNGISIHRFQNVVWTIIAIFVYFYRYTNPKPDNNDALPDLDPTLLALTGISSATYLVLKSRENNSQKKPINLKIALSFDIPPPEKTDIENSPNGLNKASIELINDNGERSHASPDTIDPKFTFVAVAEPGKHYKLEVAWKENINGKDINLVGSSEVDIESTATSKDISVQLKKQS